jgi:hypothetical protein
MYHKVTLCMSKDRFDTEIDLGMEMVDSNEESWGFIVGFEDHPKAPDLIWVTVLVYDSKMDRLTTRLEGVEILPPIHGGKGLLPC